MKCDDFTALLAGGDPLSQSVKEHVASCAACRLMMESLKAPEAELRPDQVKRLQHLVMSSLQPVRPLPSENSLMLIFLAGFVVFCLLATVPLHFRAYRVLTVYQNVAYYGLLLVLAAAFSRAVVERMIPGAMRRINTAALVTFTLLSLALISIPLFVNFGLNRFVQSGIPCLRLGIVCAGLSGALASLLVRRGFLTSPIETGTTAGFFAGLAGFTVLALHCPIKNALHVMAWHLGAMVASGIGGAIAGLALDCFGGRDDHPSITQR